MRWLVALAVVAGLLAVADVGTRLVAQDQLNQRLDRAVPAASETSTDIDSFPFLGRLLASGEVSRLKVRLDRVQAERWRFSSVTADMRDVRVDRQTLLEDRRVVVTGVGRSRAVAEITQEDLSEAVGVPVRLEDGRVVVAAGAVTVRVTPTVANRVLSLGRFALARPNVPIPRLALLPCVSGVEVLPGRLRMSCTFSEVPPELIDRVQRRMNRP